MYLMFNFPCTVQGFDHEEFCHDAASLLDTCGVAVRSCAIGNGTAEELPCLIPPPRQANFSLLLLVILLHKLLVTLLALALLLLGTG
jgi:hypothetical protein